MFIYSLNSIAPFYFQALGNHEFDNGLSGLVDPFLKNVKFPIVSANIIADSQIVSNISGYYLPYNILNVGGEQIAIVGYTSKETPVLSDPGNVYFFCYIIFLIISSF